MFITFDRINAFQLTFCFFFFIDKSLFIQVSTCLLINLFDLLSFAFHDTFYYIKFFLFTYLIEQLY